MSVIIGVLLIFIIFIAGLLLWRNFSAPGTEVKTPPAANIEGTSTTSTTTAKQATQNLIEETKKLNAGNDAGKIAQIITVTRTDKKGSSTQEQAVLVAPNSNPIAVDSGEVLTRDGSAKAEENTRAGDANAILQSCGVDPAKLPASTIRLSVSPTAITPAQFSVRPGQAISLAITADGSLEIFSFADPALSAVRAGVQAGETCVLVFNAPAKTGEYVYFSSFLNHRAGGSVGKMIVK